MMAIMSHRFKTTKTMIMGSSVKRSFVRFLGLVNIQGVLECLGFLGHRMNQV